MFEPTSVSGAAHALFDSVIYVICHLRPTEVSSQPVEQSSLPRKPSYWRVMCEVQEAFPKCIWNDKLGQSVDCRPLD